MSEQSCAQGGYPVHEALNAAGSSCPLPRALASAAVAGFTLGGIVAEQQNQGSFGDERLAAFRGHGGIAARRSAGYWLMKCRLVVPDLLCRQRRRPGQPPRRPPSWSVISSSGTWTGLCAWACRSWRDHPGDLGLAGDVLTEEDDPGGTCPLLMSVSRLAGGAAPDRSR